MELVGSRFGHIRIVEVLGEGGMGSVYSGFDETLHRRVAVKALHRERRLDAVARARLMREARSLSQLDHPNICRIYDYIEGEEVDLLVLELIEGKTLQTALHDGLSRADKIRIACDIAKVLEVAHRRGIVHRDLKPDNVMLTAAGEVKVLDFGLARWLDEPAAPAPVLHTVPEDDELGWAFLDADATDSGHKTAILDHAVEHTQSLDMTREGVTLGTPLYMSPEQARGAHLTPASDMFSFGLLLQTLFTQHEPYPMDLLGSEVMRRAARGDTLPMTGDHSITALVNRLKQLAPTDRLTAHEAVARLEYIAEAPRRMWRRAIAALVILIVIGAAWKYTIDLRRERAAAVAAQHEAEHSRARADDLIGFMLGDLRRKLDSVGRLDILDSAAERSLAYMTSLRTDGMTPQEIASNVTALDQLGQVRMAQGKLPAAMQAFRQAVAFANVAHRKQPSDPDISLSLGTSHYWVGRAHLAASELPSALEEMKQYRGVAEDLARRFPSNRQYQLERVYGHSTVGTVLETQGDLAAAASEYAITVGVKNALALGAPNDAERQADLAVTLNKIGYVVERLGQLAAAHSYYEREFTIYSRLAEADPKNVRWQERVANSHAFLALSLTAIGNTDAALQHVTTAVDMFRALVAHDRSNADWQRNLAMSQKTRGIVLRVGGHAREAVTELSSAAATMNALLQRENRSAWQRDLVSAYTENARALLAIGKNVEARQQAQAAVGIPGSSKSSAVTILAADAYEVLGEANAATGAADRAQAAWQTAADALQGGIGSSHDPRSLLIYARAQACLGDHVRASEAANRLRTIGYRPSEIAQLCTGGRC